MDLNHWPQNLDAHGQSPPQKLQIHPLGEGSGRGEDDPIREQRLLRDGWDVIEYGHFVHSSANEPVSFFGTTPRIFEKPNPKQNELVLGRRWLGFGERQGTWEVLEHDVRVESVRPNESPQRLGRGEWADWDQNGDLLESKHGCLYRHRLQGNRLHDPILVADLNQASFERIIAPDEARRWPARFR